MISTRIVLSKPAISSERNYRKRWLLGTTVRIHWDNLLINTFESLSFNGKHTQRSSCKAGLIQYKCNMTTLSNDAEGWGQQIEFRTPETRLANRIRDERVTTALLSWTTLSKEAVTNRGQGMVTGEDKTGEGHGGPKQNKKTLATIEQLCCYPSALYQCGPTDTASCSGGGRY